MTRVLIVEDDPSFAAAVEACVAAIGCKVTGIASTGEEALERARAEPADLALMDIRLSRGQMDGVEAASRLGSELHIPVVFLTAFADKQTLERALALGPLGYVLKPCTERELARAIEVAIAKLEMRARREGRDAWLEVVLRSLSEGVLLLDEQGLVVDMNGVAESLTGTKLSAAHGRRWDEVVRVASPFASAIRTLIQQALSEPSTVSASAPASLEPQDGGEMPVELSAMPVTRGPAAARGVALIVRDMRDQRRIVAQLSIPQRLTALGTFAAGVAHEINNPLTAATTGLELALRDANALLSRFEAPDGVNDTQGLSLAQSLRNSLLAAQAGVGRVEVIVKDLSVFSRPGRERRPISLSGALESAVRLVENQIRHRARLVRHIDAEPLVDANESQLVRAFVELLVNAAEAIPEGAAERNTIRVVVRIAEDGSSVVEIHDTGQGMTPDLMVRMYDPFFTTKPVGAGMGLGLSIAHSIVRAHGGDLFARSEPGRGSTFTVRLQRSSEEPRVPVASAEGGGSKRLRILIADDEPSIGKLLAMLLSAAHDVIATTSAREALKKLAESAAFDVVLCDLSMPEMDGIALYQRVSAENPELAQRFVFMTGGAFTPRFEQFLASMPGRYVLKPLRLDALERMLLAATSRARRDDVSDRSRTLP